MAERYRGSMLGLATGDALGTTLEFTTSGSFRPIKDMKGGGPFDLEPGQWTDDTSMALCLAESLILRNAFDPIDQLERYLKWYKQGYLSSNGQCFDIGNTVKFALNRFIETRQPYCGPIDPQTAGNGSLMRLAPVPLFYASEPYKAIFLSGESSKTTHQAVIAVDACRYLGALIVGALNGTKKEELVSPKYSPIHNYWQQKPLCPEIESVACGSFKEKNPPRIRGSGYAAESLEATLWSFYNSDSFEEGCLMAVNLGYDADTTGAIYGQLAGAFYGEKTIPIEWLSKLAYRSKIEEMADSLHDVAIKH
ncbi:MAG: ADP-ribosylglycohydrolase family protein [Nitrososphaerales archaeon]